MENINNNDPPKEKEELNPPSDTAVSPVENAENGQTEMKIDPPSNPAVLPDKEEEKHEEANCITVSDSNEPAPLGVGIEDKSESVAIDINSGIPVENSQETNVVNINQQQLIEPVQQIVPANWLEISEKEFDLVNDYLNKIICLSQSTDVVNQDYINYFANNIYNHITNFLQFDINAFSKSQVKIAYYYILQFVKIRIKYLNVMTYQELGLIMKILTSNNVLYKSSTNNDTTKISQEDVDLMLKHEFPDKFTSLSTSLSFSNEVITSMKANFLYTGVLEFVLRENIIEKLLDFLSNMNSIIATKEMYSMIIFYLPSILQCYDKHTLLSQGFSLKLIKITMNKFNSEFDNDDRLKDNAKMVLDLNLRPNLLTDINTLAPIYDSNSDIDLDLVAFFTKDLKIAQRCLNINNLEKRIIGITLINELCNLIYEIENKISMYCQIQNFIPLLKMKTNITIDFLVNTMRIYDIIFGENIHEAVISKSSFILKFLYKKGKFDTEHIMSLWKLSQEKHQSISESILNVLRDLIPIFSIEHCSFIITMINTMSLKEINEATLNLLENVGDNLTSNEQKENFIKVLFKLSNENENDNGLAINIILKTRMITSKILLKQNFRNFLLKIIKKCIYNIGSYRMLNTYMNILWMILAGIKNNNNINDNIYATAFNNEAVTDFVSMMKFLDEKYSLMNTMLFSFLDAKNEVIAIVREISKKSEVNFDIADYDNNNNINNKLDMTQSTEKSLDDIEVDDDIDISIEYDSELIKNKIVNRFIEEHKDDINTVKENYEFVFRNLKLNFLHMNYFAIVNSVFAFVKNIINSSSVTLTKKQIEFLYKIFVENCVDEEEINLFFNFFSDILKWQHLTKIEYLNEKDLVYLYFDLFTKLEIKSLPFSAFDFVNNFFVLINSVHNNIIINTNTGKIVAINNFSLLVGFDTIWRFYLLSANENISVMALNLLVNIITVVIEKKENVTIVTERVFNEISASMKSNDHSLLIKLINLLNIFNAKISSSSSLRENKEISLTVKNNYYSNDGPSKTIFVKLSDTVAKVKEIIISNVICQNGNFGMRQAVNTTGIILQWKGKRLNDGCTLNDYGIEDNGNVLVFKDDPMYREKEIDNATLNRLVVDLKNIFDYDDEILKLALKKNNANIEEATIYLTSEEHVIALKEEINSSKNEIAPKGSCINDMFTEEKLNLLISLLDMNKSDINEAVWKLLSSIKIPKNIKDMIKEKKYEMIFTEENKNKLLLYLRIINSVIFNNENFCEIDESIDKREWISSLMLDGLQSMLKCIESNVICIEDNVISSMLIMMKWLQGIFFKVLQMKNYNKDNVSLTAMINWLTKQRSSDENKDKIVINEIMSEIVDKFLFNFINENFNKTIWTLLSNSMTHSKHSTISDSIIIIAIDILLVYIEINPEGFKEIFDKEIEVGVILKMLLGYHSKNVRKAMNDFFKGVLIFYGDKPYKESTVISVIGNHIVKDNEKILANEIVYEEYFDLFAFVISYMKLEETSIKFDELVRTILNRIGKYNNTENDTTIDDILSGHIHVLINISAKYPEIVISAINASEFDIISFLYQSLFSSLSSSVFKSKHLRNKSYSLLIQLMHLSQEYKTKITKLILKHHTTFKSNSVSTDFDIPIRTNSDKYIGLRNFGATCYLNSLFQQLFMMPSFKNSIFSIPIDLNSEEDKSSVISNLQIAFANLSLSLKKFYPPLPFIQSIKSAFNSEPINVSVQQDSDEFLAIVSDEVEKEAKKKGNEDILSSSFKGTIVNEIFSLEKEYPYYSHSDESFIRLTLDIKGHKSIEDALDYFVKDEVLEGENKFFVEKYNRKISISKRSSIKAMSNNVIIHLKRFEFDYNLFMNNKLNDYIQFPFSINFKKWTQKKLNKENNDNVDYDYTLTGVLIHSGSSLQHGHYFSFIMDINDKKWYRFDDTVVSEFDINNIPIECFGDDNQSNVNGYRKCQNAYLLFYTKTSIVNSNSKISAEINPQIKKMIEEENNAFVTMKNYIDDDYYKFIKDFVDCNVNNENEVSNGHSLSKKMRKEEQCYELMKSMLSSTNDNKNELPENIKEVYQKCKEEIESRTESNAKNENDSLVHQVMKFSIFYLFDVIFNQSDKNKIVAYSSFIVDKINSHSFTAIWLLKKIENNQKIFCDLITNNNNEIRHAFQQIIFTSLIAAYHHETTINSLTEQFTTFNPDTKQFIKNYRSITMRFIINVIFSHFPDIITNVTRCDCYLSLLRDLISSIAEISFEPLPICQSLLQFIFTNVNNNGMNTIVQTSIDVFVSVILHLPTKGIKLESAYPSVPNVVVSDFVADDIVMKINTDKICNEIFACSSILSPQSGIAHFILKNHNEEVSQVKLVHHLCYNNMENSVRFLRGINGAIRTHMKDITSMCNIVNTLKGIFPIEDEYAERRDEIFFELYSMESAKDSTIFDFMFSYRDELIYSISILLYALGSIIIATPHTRSYIMSRRERLIWIEYFVKDIYGDNNKLSALTIEATADSFAFNELLSGIKEMYVDSMGISEENINPHHNINAYGGYIEDINNDNTFNLLN